MDELIPFFAIGVTMLIPIIVILTSHQRKMAELYREERTTRTLEQQVAAENESLRKELSDMKTLMYEQSIAIDNLGKKSTTGDLSDRLEQKL